MKGQAFGARQPPGRAVRPAGPPTAASAPDGIQPVSLDRHRATADFAGPADPVSLDKQ